MAKVNINSISCFFKSVGFLHVSLSQSYSMFTFCDCLNHTPIMCDNNVNNNHNPAKLCQ